MRPVAAVCTRDPIVKSGSSTARADRSREPATTSIRPEPTGAAEEPLPRPRGATAAAGARLFCRIPTLTVMRIECSWRGGATLDNRAGAVHENCGAAQQVTVAEQSRATMILADRGSGPYRTATLP